jgi:hypothetical protein
MYCNKTKTSQFHVVHHFTYSAFKVELNIIAPEVCPRFRFRLLPLGKKNALGVPGPLTSVPASAARTPHVSIINVLTNTDVKEDEARRSLRPIPRSATTNPATRKMLIHIMRYMSADTCGAEARWKYSTSPYQRSRFRWSSGLRLRSKASRLLGLLFRIPPEAQISLSDECCVLSGRGLCDGPIARPEEFYRICVSLIVIMCNNTALHLQ